MAPVPVMEAPDVEQLLRDIEDMGRKLAKANLVLSMGKVLSPVGALYPEQAWEQKLKTLKETGDRLDLLGIQLREAISLEEQDKGEVEGMALPLNPFVIFPEEVWEVVLGNLEDSQDIINVFRAFPGLDGHVMKNKYGWLIEQVMPHIFPLIGAKDVLACRQVSRRWCHGVDSFLETDPERRARDFEVNPGTGQRRIPEASQAHYSIRKGFRGVRPFRQRSMLHQFDRDMGNHPRGRNPFVGRSITFNLPDYYHFEDEDDEQEDHDPEAYWQDVVAFLRKFGDHLWTVKMDPEVFCQNVCRLFLEVFRLLPNLKALEVSPLTIYHFDRTSVGTGEMLPGSNRGESVPGLPQPESFSISRSPCERPKAPDRLVRMLVVHASTTIRRLSLCSCRCKWMVEEHPGLDLPQLTDFTLTKCATKKDIRVILRALQAPGLCRLELQLNEDQAYMYRANIFEGAEIGSWLNPFPKLHSFKLCIHNRRNYYLGDHEDNDSGWYYCKEEVFKDVAEEEATLKPGSESEDSSRFINNFIPSLKSVHLEGYCKDMTFDFLNSFPNLEYIKVDSSFRFHHFETYELYGTRMWEMFPKLKEVTVTIKEDRYYGGAKYNFHRNRNEYELLKRDLPGSIPEEIFGGISSILVRLGRNLDDRSEWKHFQVGSTPLLLTSGDYRFHCTKVEICTETGQGSPEPRWTRVLSWVDVLNVLRKCGDRISSLEFEADLTLRVEELYRIVCESLFLLPNLTKLNITGYYHGYNAWTAAQEFKLLLGQPNLPSLQHLETLSIPCYGCDEGCVPPGLVKFIVFGATETLRKLKICRSNWIKMKEIVYLLKLEELSMAGFRGKMEVDEVLSSIKAHSLKELDLKLWLSYTNSKLALPDGGDIPSWLKRFSELHTFRLSAYRGSWRKGADDERKDRTSELGTPAESATALVPSLKFFRYEGHSADMNFDFLECFPKLEYLEIDGDDNHHGQYFDEKKLAGPEIWEMLPQLTEFAIWIWICEFCPSYHREKVCRRKSRTEYELEWPQKKLPEVEPVAVPNLVDNLECSGSTLPELTMSDVEDPPSNDVVTCDGENPNEDDDDYDW